MVESLRVAEGGLKSLGLDSGNGVLGDSVPSENGSAQVFSGILSGI
jgi:hypothetical protein